MFVFCWLSCKWPVCMSTMGPCVRCRRDRLLHVFVFLSSVVIEGNDGSRAQQQHRYRLIPPDLYVVFSGDLQVLFHMPDNVSLPNAFVQLHGQTLTDTAWKEVTTMGLPLSRKTGTLIVACGVVEFAGRYSLTMVMQVDGPVLTRVTFTSVWPSLTLRLPDVHAVLTSSVTMEIESHAKCSSRLQREFLILELYFQRFGDAGSSFVNFSNVETVTAANFTSIDKPRLKWNYACEVFDLEGYYQAGIRSSTGTTLTVSNVMTSTFSVSYHLSSKRSSVLPCRANSSVIILYTHPPCAGVDKFRVYRLVRREPQSLAAHLERVYVGEFEVHPSRTRVEVKCEVVDVEEKVVGYCWLYMTVARSGLLVEHAQLCLPTWPGGVLPQDGGWSSWTVWTTCSVTCGPGKRSRFRICNNPPPEHGGRHCVGHPRQWTLCLQSCPDLLPRSPLTSPHFDPSCFCGCVCTTESGDIIASGRCPGLATWIIKTLPQQRVVLTFRYFSISVEKQWVKVRDGKTGSDDLLFYSRHQPQPPSDITSSSNVMRVELMTETDMMSPVGVSLFPRNATMPIHVRGFIAAYHVKVPGSSPLPPPIFRPEDSSIMDSDVAIVGLAVVGAVVVALVVFVVVQRKIFRRKKGDPHSQAQTLQVKGPGNLELHLSSGGGQAGSGLSVRGHSPFAGGEDSGRKSASDPRLASRTSSFTSTGSQHGKARAHLSENTANRQGQARAASPDTVGIRSGVVMQAVGHSPNKARSATPRRHSASLEKRLPDHPKTTAIYAVVHQFAPTLEHPLSEQKRSSRHPSATSPPRYSSPMRPEPAERRHRRKKGASAHYSSKGRGGDQELGSSSRVSSSTNPVGDVLSGHQTTTKAEINIVQPQSMSTCIRSPEDRSVSIPGRHVQSRTDFQDIRFRKDKGRRRSDGDKHFQREHFSLVQCGEQPNPRLSHASHRPSSTRRETALPTIKVKRPVSIKDNVISLQPGGVKTAFNLESSMNAESKRSRSRTMPPSDPAGCSAAPEQEALLPKPHSEVSESEEAETALKGRNSGLPSSSKSSNMVVKSEGYKTLAPLTAPAVELEYDDFVLHHPQSYFQYEYVQDGGHCDAITEMK